MKFTLPIIPTAQARGRAGINHAGKAMIFTGRNQRRHQNDLIALMAPYAPEMPLSGPLELSIRVFKPVPVSWPKKKQRAALAWEIWPTGTPDLDNYQKQIMDCMTALHFWNDDSQVAIITARKTYGEKPRWEIALEEIRTVE
jgi:Holliday junction resolvase RusA-like endonuclease